MATRSVDPKDFYEGEQYEVQLGYEITDGDLSFDSELDRVDTWISERCEGTYMILIRSVWFNLEKDALIFRIGYAKV